MILGNLNMKLFQKKMSWGWHLKPSSSKNVRKHVKGWLRGMHMISLGLAERGLMPYKNVMAQMGRNTDLSWSCSSPWSLCFLLLSSKYWEWRRVEVQSSIHNPFPHTQTPQKRPFPYLTLVIPAIYNMNVTSIWQLVLATPTIPSVLQNMQEIPLHI